MANHLVNSDSPYLLQHKDNPVDWYPYSKEAFDKAQKENKLIFLSIGYSTCHWCHVMARESFENQEIADILNKDFVSIKIDREEMPDIDKKYQNIYQVMHQRGGGWPLTIIMTPDGDVFYSATYIPPHTTHFGAGLKELLIQIVQDWHTNPKKILNIANNLKQFLSNKTKKEKVELNLDVINIIKQKIMMEFDNIYGGFKGAPKFPMETSFDMLIDIYLLTKDKDILNIINFSLEKMAKGGIFDQIEGGFYRYSTDEKWLIPHFEKMLYNNANLPIIYLRMYKVTNNELFKEVAFRSLDEMINRYRNNNGLFYSASNAESEGIEGKYFTYYYDEVESEFNEFDNKNELLNYFGIKKYGEFNGRNNPTINSNKPKNYKEALKTLQNIRKQKEFPFIDTKKITSWNSMMISALLKAGCEDEKYRKIALKTLDELIQKMYINGVLYHSYNKNENAKTPGLLEDYSYFLKALIDAYESNFNQKYLDLAKEIAKKTEIFYEKTWFMNKEKNIQAEFSDSAYASSLSILAQDFLRLSTLIYDYELYQKAVGIIEEGSYYISKYPLYYPSITKAYLMKEKGIYVLSTKKPMCNEFEYPYIEFKYGENYEICTIEKCLKKSESLESIKHIIK